MSADLLALLARMTLAASAAIAVILLIRQPLRAAFGAQVAYASWLMAPLATLAAFLPARHVYMETPAPVAAAANAQAQVDAAPIAQPASDLVTALPAIDFNFAPILLFVWLVGVFFSLLVLLRDHQR